MLKPIAEKWSACRFPVTQLKCALYGHPDSVTYWELLCASELKKVDFVPLGSEWPSVFFHNRLKLLLTVYLDDFKLAGPQAHLAEGWALLRSRLDIGPESSSGMYLGCNIIKGQIRRQRDGAMLNSITYDMESFLEQCVARYLTVAGPNVKLREAHTPFLTATAVRGPYRDPVAGTTGCQWCGLSQMLMVSKAHTLMVRGACGFPTTTPQHMVRGACGFPTKPPKQRSSLADSSLPWLPVYS